MKLEGLEETIDGLVEELVQGIKKEIEDREDITIAIKHQDISKRKKKDKKIIMEPVFLVTEDDMIPFTIFWDDFELFKPPYVDLDFYIKSKMMQWQGQIHWYLIWFKSIQLISTGYSTKKLFEKMNNDLKNET